MTPEDLFEARYGGAYFGVTTANTTGGRNTTKKKIPLSDRQIIEDLGLTPRSFRLSGVLYERRAASGQVVQSFEDMRDALLRQLEAGQTKPLVHPDYGEIENVACISYDLSTTMTRVGEAAITMTFEISEGDGRPIVFDNRIDDVIGKNEELQTALADAFAFESPIGDPANVADAIEQQDSVVSAFDEATTLVPALADEIDSFTAELTAYSDAIVSLIQDPLGLVTQLQGLYRSVNNLYVETIDAVTGVVNAPAALSDGFRNTFGAFGSLFDFDDLADAIDGDSTVSRRIRLANRLAVRSTVRIAALGFAYENGAQITFETVSAIDDVQELLEAQYQSVRDEIPPTVREPLEELRTAAVLFFEAEKLNARRVTTVETPLTSARLLAFNLYGESDLGEDIAALNDLPDSALVVGDVSVFTGGDLGGGA